MHLRVIYNHIVHSPLCSLSIVLVHTFYIVACQYYILLPFLHNQRFVVISYFDDFIAYTPGMCRMCLNFNINVL